MALSQGKIISRPSERLDHSDPRTALLPPEEQMYYQYATKRDVEKVITENIRQGA